MKGLTHAESRAQRTRTCEQCGSSFMAERIGHIRKYCTRRCSSLAGAAMRGVLLTEEQKQTARYERTYREVDAPGMNRRARANLLHEWIRQGKCCAYCNSKASLTVDHVIPLALGGSNYIGNLAPCCKACNSSKGHRLTIEWKHGRPARKTLRQQQRSAPKPKARKQRPNPIVRDCTICSKPTVNPRCCSDECRTEQNRRLQRDRYRSRQGLLVDPQQPTSKWELAA